MNAGKRGSIVLGITIVLLLGVFTGSKWFGKEPYIVATSPNNPPMEMIDKNKNIVGFDIDIIHSISKKSDMNIEIVPVLKTNLFHGLIDETYDIVISSITVSDITIASENMGIATSASYLTIGEVLLFSEDFEDFRGLDSLVGKEVGIRNGAKSKQVLQDYGNIHIREYRNIERAFEDLVIGKLQAICLELPTAAQYANYNDEYKRILNIYPEPVTSEKYFIAVKKNKDKLLERINQGIKEIKKDGTLDRLVEKWFFSE